MGCLTRPLDDNRFSFSLIALRKSGQKFYSIREGNDFDSLINEKDLPRTMGNKPNPQLAPTNQTTLATSRITAKQG